MQKELNENLAFGYICLARSIRKNWIWDFKDPLKYMWWSDLLMEVNHTESKVRIGNDLKVCGRGESLKSLHTWALRWRADVSTVRRFFKLLEKDGMIAYQNEGKTIRITVCNYDTYNSPRNDGETMLKRKRNDAENKQELKNDKKNNKGIEPVLMQVVFSDKDKIEFERFQERTATEFPSVATMRKPFTIQEFLKVKEKTSDEIIFDLIEDMDIWLIKNPDRKSQTAYGTFLTFYKKRFNSTNSNSNQVNQPAQRKLVI